MRTAQTVLTVIQERGKQHKPIERVYKLLFNRDFYLNAYAKVTHRNELLQEDDFSIVQQFQAEYRGLIQYYILAQNLSWFSTLYWVMETSLLKTFQSGIKWYINLGKLVDYYNNSGRNAAG